MISVKFLNTVVIRVWEGDKYKWTVGFIVPNKSYIRFPVDDIIEESDYTIYNCKTNTTPEYVHYVIYD